MICGASASAVSKSLMVSGSVEGDECEHFESESEGGGVDDRSVAAQHPGVFERAGAALTARHAEGDAFGEVGERSSRRLTEGAQ